MPSGERGTGPSGGENGGVWAYAGALELCPSHVSTQPLHPSHTSKHSLHPLCSLHSPMGLRNLLLCGLAYGLVLMLSGSEWNERSEPWVGVVVSPNPHHHPGSLHSPSRSVRSLAHSLPHSTCTVSQLKAHTRTHSTSPRGEWKV